MVPYKRMDLIVDAFTQMPDRRLIVVGEGPDLDAIRARGNEYHGAGLSADGRAAELHAAQRAFVFAAEEDFGIVPVEAQACGTPVIAFGKGAIHETVVEGVTGIFFDQQTVPSLIAAVEQFESQRAQFDPYAARQNAERFSAAHSAWSWPNWSIEAGISLPGSAVRWFPLRGACSRPRRRHRTRPTRPCPHLEKRRCPTSQTADVCGATPCNDNVPNRDRTPATRLVFTNNLLPFSETFVVEQSRYLQTFRPVFVGLVKVPGLTTPPERTVLLNAGTLAGRVEEVVFKSVGIGPRFISALRRLNPVLIHAHFGTSGVYARCR